ncbi:MAG: hypothetical protein ABI818_01405 [Acidobacteriota bacterium]
MRTPECPREQELLEALAGGRWPDGAVTELEMHAGRCDSCTELLTVALPLLREHELAERHARIPSSGVVWWRAQMRARREAVDAATRPIAWTQGLALACAAGLAAGVATFAETGVRAWLGWGVTALAALDPRTIDLARLQALAPAGTLPLVALGLLVVVAPMAIYLAVADE